MATSWECSQDGNSKLGGWWWCVGQSNTRDSVPIQFSCVRYIGPDPVPNCPMDVLWAPKHSKIARHKSTTAGKHTELYFIFRYRSNMMYQMSWILPVEHRPQLHQESRIDHHRLFPRHYWCIPPNVLPWLLKCQWHSWDEYLQWSSHQLLCLRLERKRKNNKNNYHGIDIGYNVRLYNVPVYTKLASIVYPGKTPQQWDKVNHFLQH